MDHQRGSPRLRKHLLLFYWPGSPPDLGAEARGRLTRDLEAWARTLETRGELMFMADLSPDQAGTWIGGPSGQELSPTDRPELPVALAGVCILRARDRASAVEAARHSPLVASGGLVAVHDLDQP